MARKSVQCIWPGCEHVTHNATKLCGHTDPDGTVHGYRQYLNMVGRQAISEDTRSVPAPAAPPPNPKGTPNVR